MGEVQGRKLCSVDWKCLNESEVADANDGRITEGCTALML